MSFVPSKSTHGSLGPSLEWCSFLILLTPFYEKGLFHSSGWPESNGLFVTEIAEDDNSAAMTFQAIGELPAVNRDTLAFLMLHLQR